MPFTTYHLAVGLLVGLLLRRWVHWPTLLITTTVLVDVEPLLVMLGLVDGRLHGYTHNFLVGLVLGFVSGVFMYFLDGVLVWLRDLYKAFYLSGSSGGLAGYILAGILGWQLHVLMDAPMHRDMTPLEPLVPGNLLLAPYDIFIYTIHPLYFMLLLVGLGSYLAYFLWSSTRDNGLRVALFQLGVLLVLASIPMLPVEVNDEVDLSNPFLVSAPVTLTLALSGLLTSTLALASLSILPPWRATAITLLALAILYASIKLGYLVEFLLVAYPIVAITLLIARKPLSKLRVTMGRITLSLIDATIISWLLTVVLIGIPMLALTLTLLVMKASQLRDLAKAGSLEGSR